MHGRTIEKIASTIVKSISVRVTSTMAGGRRSP